MAYRKIVKESEGGQKYVTEQEEELVFDQVPTKGSFNPVTSDGVANALSVGEGSAQTALTTYAQNVAHSIAPEFDQTRNYVVDDSCTYEGTAYIFTSNHPAGAWNPAHATISGQNALLWLTAQNALQVANKQIFANSDLNISDLNDVKENSVTIIQRTADTHTLNLPSGYTSGLAILSTYKAYYVSNKYQIIQFLVKTETSETWCRQQTNGVWGNWTNSNPSNSYHIGPGKTYTTIRAGIAAAMAFDNSVVYIHPGVYDLVTEFADLIGAGMGVVGNPIGKGITIICYDGVQIKANFDFSDGYSAEEKSAIYSKFNPFYAVEGDFRLVNLNIEATNTRYCVHDENGGSGNHIHEYINCKMKYNVDYYDGAIRFVQCIGGGFGEHTTVVVDGGYYESNTSIGLPSVENYDDDYAQQPISYHNGNNVNCESSITLRNVYFADKGYLRISDYGPSTKLSKVYASGCRFAYPILHKYETPDLGHDNFAVTADWNNDIANNGSWNIAADGYTATWTPS